MKTNWLFWGGVIVLGYLFFKRRTSPPGIANPGQNSIGNGPSGFGL
jgi:hypothetical protein